MNARTISMLAKIRNLLLPVSKLIPWRQWLIRHGLFDVLDIALINNTETYHELSASVKEEWRAAGSYREMVNIEQALQLTAHLDGAVAELGACRGGVSKMIATICTDRPIHLFDTFTGIPYRDVRYDIDSVGTYATDIDEVKDYLKDFKNVVFHQGLFPETAKDVTGAFSFVYMDMCQYQSTFDALKFFYPKLVAGGMMISHDYSTKGCSGVKQALLDYSKQQRIIYFPIWDCSVLVVKAS